MFENPYNPVAAKFPNEYRSLTASTGVNGVTSVFNLQSAKARRRVKKKSAERGTNALKINDCNV
jgi:hypothetical protein